MGIFDLFKKLIKENKVEEIVIEKLAFSDLENWIEDKLKENELKEKEILVIIREKIKVFTEGFREKIHILESVNVEAKKEKEEIKGIVNNSRKDYIKSVENFLENLNNLEMNEFEESMKKINKIFFDFNKGSYKNYERATILIGKEMRVIKEGLRAFSKELTKTFDKSKGIVDSFKRISTVKSELYAIHSSDRILGKISEAIVSLNEKIKSKEEENKRLSEEVQKIKKSPNYLECLRTQKKIESLKEELKNDIFRLKQLLDFKALANFFHINKEQMNILKDHKENFQTNFQKDNGKMIVDLLDEAKLNNNTILEKVNLIRAKIEETLNYERDIKEDETQELYSRIKSVVMEIDTLKIEKVKEEKRGEKIKRNKEELRDSLKQELAKLNVEVI
jgi:hypothetical protein